MNYVRTEAPDLSSARQDGEAGPAFAPIAATVEDLLNGVLALDRVAPPLDRTARAPTGLAPWQVLRVRDHVEIMLSGAIQVACLARVAKLSPSHFARAFRASFGVTPAAYVVARRVERAKTLMLDTPDSLSSICLDCGFTDQSHLSRAFRRQVGQPPSQWRRAHRQD